MVHNIWDYLWCGLLLLPDTVNYATSRTWIGFRPQVRRWETPTPMGLSDLTSITGHLVSVYLQLTYTGGGQNNGNTSK
jgi:hypothetical protein